MRRARSRGLAVVVPMRLPREAELRSPVRVRVNLEWNEESEAEIRGLRRFTRCARSLMRRDSYAATSRASAKPVRVRVNMVERGIGAASRSCSAEGSRHN